MLTLCLVMGCTVSAQPILSNVALDAQGNGYTVRYESSEGGMLAMRLQDESGVNAADIGAVSIDAGQGQVFWDGILPDERALEEGTYNLTVRMRNFWGEESNPVTLSLTCGAGDAGEPAAESLSLAEMQALARNEDAEAEMIAHDEPAPAAETEMMVSEPSSPAAQAAPAAPASTVPVATSFWTWIRMPMI